MFDFIRVNVEPVSVSAVYQFVVCQTAVSDLLESVRDADILVFVVPHQFVKGICDKINGHIKPDAHAVTLIKVVRLALFIFLVQMSSI